MSDLTVSCPTCKADVVWNETSEWKPFCSDRCRLIDLGAWADEQYAIPADEPPTFQDADAPPPPDTLN